MGTYKRTLPDGFDYAVPAKKPLPPPPPFKPCPPVPPPPAPCPPVPPPAVVEEWAVYPYYPPY